MNRVPKSGSNVEKPEGWTKEDKFNLYQGLRACGSSQDIEVIKSVLPDKTTEEIVQMINYFKEKAKIHPDFAQKKVKRRQINKLSRVPLAMWAKYLTDSLNYSELQTETANALRVIAECEDIPAPFSTGNVDFRMIYNTVADAMEGKSLPDDPNINHIIETCIVETACTSKSFILKSSINNIIGSVNLEEKDITVFPKPTADHELATLRHLASQRNYNPLNITENFLKPSVYSSSSSYD